MEAFVVVVVVVAVLDCVNSLRIDLERTSDEYKQWSIGWSFG